MTVVGTRPEIIKLAEVIKKLDEHFEHILVHTGQNYDYELNEVFFKDLGIREPDVFLDAARDTAIRTIGNIMMEIEAQFEEHKPDALLIYGDTNSCLCAYVAKRMKIPVFHMEAGNRCFDQRVPEELNRKVIDHISDINMTVSEHARQYLIQEGIRPETVIKVGSSMREVMSKNMKLLDLNSTLSDNSLIEGKYFLVSLHREENVDSDNFEKTIDALNGLAEKYSYPIIVSTHPRTRARLDKSGVKCNELINFSKPFGFYAYQELQMNAACVISDSGTITEECSLLEFPAVTIREAHERPEGMDNGVLIMSSLDKESLLDSVKIATEIPQAQEYVDDYFVDDVSCKVVKIISSYIDYVNRTVWRK